MFCFVSVCSWKHSKLALLYPRWLRYSHLANQRYHSGSFMAVVWWRHFGPQIDLEVTFQGDDEDIDA